LLFSASRRVAGLGVLLKRLLQFLQVAARMLARRVGVLLEPADVTLQSLDLRREIGASMESPETHGIQARGTLELGGDFVD
jgi:hypothetical protein